MPPTTSGRKRVHLDREMILATAREIFHREGLDSLTLRKLGEELGVDATAMYRHFRNKASLMTALIDELFVDIAEPDPKEHWRHNLRELMLAWWGVYRNNQGLAEAIAGQPDDEPRLSLITEWTLRELQRAGVPSSRIGLTQLAIYNLVVGSSLVTAYSPWLGDETSLAQHRRIAAALDPAAFPTTTDVAQHLFPTPHEVFLYSVDALLDMIEHRAEDDAAT